MVVQVIEYVVFWLIFLAVCTVVTSPLAFFLAALTLIGEAALSTVNELRSLAVFFIAVLAILGGSGSGYLIGRRVTQWQWVPKMMTALSGNVDIAKVGQQVGSIAQSGLVRIDKYYGVIRAPIPIMLGAMQFPLKKWLPLTLCASVWVVGTLSLVGFAVGLIADGALEREVFTTVVKVTWLCLGLLGTAVHLFRRAMKERALR